MVLRSRQATAGDSFLEATGGVIQPGAQKCCHHLAHHVFLGCARHRQGPPGGEVSFPAIVCVGRDELFRCGAHQGLTGALGQATERFEQQRQGRETELGPDPAAPLAVLGFQIPDAAAGLGVGFAVQALETCEHLVFAGGVVGGPSGEVFPADGQAHLLGLDPAQEFGDTREGGGVFCKALPDLVPTALALG